MNIVTGKSISTFNKTPFVNSVLFLLRHVWRQFQSTRSRRGQPQLVLGHHRRPAALWRHMLLLVQEGLQDSVNRRACLEREWFLVGWGKVPELSPGVWRYLACPVVARSCPEFYRYNGQLGYGERRWRTWEYGNLRPQTFSTTRPQNPPFPNSVD